MNSAVDENVFLDTLVVIEDFFKLLLCHIWLNSMQKNFKPKNLKNFF